MPDPLSHNNDMLIIKPNQLPDFWWLNPWHHAKRLSKTVFALRDYADAHDDALTIAKSELQEAGESIAMLQRKVREITEERDNAYRVNKNVNEALSKLTGTIAAARMATPDTCLDGHGPESWMKNTVALLDRVTKERDATDADLARIEALHDELKDKFTEVRYTLFKAGCFSEDSTALGMAQHLARWMKGGKAKPAKKKGGRK